MSEPITVLEWLSAYLKGDATLAAMLPGGWHKFPILGAPVSPFGMVRMHTSAQDLTAMEDTGSDAKIWVPTVFQVNVYDRQQNTHQRLKGPADRIYTLLQGTQATTASGIIFSAYRVQVHADTEVIGQVIENFITQQFAIDVKDI